VLLPVFERLLDNRREGRGYRVGIYVETEVRADLDELWRRTQDPACRRRWDLRFTEIESLPRTDGAPARFHYATRVLPGLVVTGTGVSAGESEREDGTRTSALRFVCSHRLSLLAEGSDHWRYVPDGEGVRLLTGYDYRPRWGRPGALLDRAVLRPLTGWATAWSFDRLRLWLERGISPERALLNWVAEMVVRALLIAVSCVVLLAGPGPLAAVVGPLGPETVFAYPLLAAVATTLALIKTPLPGTPAARRCLRTPPLRTGAPRVLRTLEAPAA
jgi:hypothetical protein